MLFGGTSVNFTTQSTVYFSDLLYIVHSGSFRLLDYMTAPARASAEYEQPKNAWILLQPELFGLPLPALAGASMVTLGRRPRLIIFGGYNKQYFNSIYVISSPESCASSCLPNDPRNRTCVELGSGSLRSCIWFKSLKHPYKEEGDELPAAAKNVTIIARQNSYRMEVSRPSVLGELPLPRYRHTATAVGGEYMLIFGGSYVDSATRVSVFLADLHVAQFKSDSTRGNDFSIQFVTQQWTVEGNGPIGRAGHAATMVAGRYLVIFGGYMDFAILNDVHVLDCGMMLRNESFVATSPFPKRLRWLHDIVEVSGKVNQLSFKHELLVPLSRFGHSFIEHRQSHTLISTGGFVDVACETPADSPVDGSCLDSGFSNEVWALNVSALYQRAPFDIWWSSNVRSKEARTLLTDIGDIDQVRNSSIWFESIQYLHQFNQSRQLNSSINLNWIKMDTCQGGLPPRGRRSAVSAVQQDGSILFTTGKSEERTIFGTVDVFFHDVFQMAPWNLPHFNFSGVVPPYRVDLS
eukprot:GILJ01006636.1.p1 GENE.GILJ01006636.1~~GILJ01006636.1.p1  ORF type:complete len:593 (+),score=81.06 GILJ01006636.1:219-1781(+)